MRRTNTFGDNKDEWVDRWFACQSPVAEGDGPDAVGLVVNRSIERLRKLAATGSGPDGRHAGSPIH